MSGCTDAAQNATDDQICGQKRMQSAARATFVSLSVYMMLNSMPVPPILSVGCALKYEKLN